MRRKGGRGSWLEWTEEEAWLEETESRKEKRKENERELSSLENESAGYFSFLFV